MMRINRLTVDVAVDRIIAELGEKGAVIVEGFLPKSVVDRFNREIDPLLAARSTSHGHPNEVVEFFHGPQTKHLTGVAGVSDTFIDEVLLHPVYKAVGDHFLLPNCSEYLLNIAHVLDRGPGADNQLMHRDQDVWPRSFTRHVEGPIQFASILALSEYSAAMGATRVVPGSHQWEVEREPTPDEIVVAEMEPGSAVLYLGSTLHGAGANSTDHMRRGMHTSFCLGWLRTEENLYLSTPLERVRAMPRRAQELLGFGIHDGISRGEGFLGAVDNRNPVDLLASGEI